MILRTILTDLEVIKILIRRQFGCFVVKAKKCFHLLPLQGKKNNEKIRTERKSSAVPGFCNQYYSVAGKISFCNE